VARRRMEEPFLRLETPLEGKKVVLSAINGEGKRIRFL